MLLVAVMNPRAEELKERTHRFFVRVLKFCESLPRGRAADSIGRQLIDAGGAADSNYRAACRSRSVREFIAKIGVAAEEADECIGWLRALVAAAIGDTQEAQSIIREADELTRIFVASARTAARNLEAATHPHPRRQP